MPIGRFGKFKRALLPVVGVLFFYSGTGATPIGPGLSLVLESAEAMSTAERRWGEAISRVAKDWSADWPRLRRPFPFTRAPERVALTLKAGGERDAYTCGQEAICADLGAWVRA